MSPAHGTDLWLRVAPEPAALERVLRQVRARLGSGPRITLARGDDGAHELRVAVGPDEDRADQARAELLALRDVTDARIVTPESGPAGREMALVRLRPAGASSGDAGEDGTGDVFVSEEPPRIQVVSRDGADVVVEVTGRGCEIDRVLDEWRAGGRLLSASRTGELVLPPGPEAGPGTDPVRQER